MAMEDIINSILEHIISSSITVGMCIPTLKYEKGDNNLVLDILHNYAKFLFQKENVMVGGNMLYSYLRYDAKFQLSPVEDLILSGVGVIEVIPLGELSKYQKMFDDTLLEFPEYRRKFSDKSLDANSNSLVYVAGGFAALGNPSSFHNNFVRKLRRKAYAKVRGVMKDYASFMSDEKFYLSSLPDRMMSRKRGQAPVAEAWHRDVMPPGMLKDGDEIFGGWINLDSKPQTFSCVLGSHADKTLQELDPGFATLEGSIRRGYKKHNLGEISSKDMKAKIDSVSKNGNVVTIPPGHMIVFPQYILHEVVAKKASYDMRRLFTGWRLSKEPGMLYPDKLFQDQGVIPLPGGMIPPMYSRNHLSYFQTKPFQVSAGVKYSLVEWSKVTFEERCLVNHKDIILIPRHMKSLKDYGFDLYKPYTEDEMKIYTGIKL